MKLTTIFKFAGAFIAALIGSGFATGQEILQYFVSYGMNGLLVATLMLLLFLYVGYTFVSVGHQKNLTRGSEVFAYFCGRRMGVFYDYFTVVFVFLSYVVMVAGAGATLHQQFGLPLWVGSVILMGFSSGIVLFGLGSIVNVLGKMGPVIIGVTMFVGVFAVLKNPSGVLAGAALVQTGTVTLLQAGEHWLQSALSYVGFCMLWLAVFLSAMGASVANVREARVGVMLGAVGFSLGCVTMMLGLMAHVVQVAPMQIPSLVLAAMIHPAFSQVFSVLIVVGICTASIPLLWQPVSRFTTEGTPMFRIMTIVLGVVGCFIGLMLPFDRLVNIIYVINGYVGILLLLFMVVKQVCVWKDRGR